MRRSIGATLAEQRAVEEADHASLVLPRPRVDPAGMAALGHLLDLLGRPGGLVVVRGESAQVSRAGLDEQVWPSIGCQP